MTFDGGGNGPGEKKNPTKTLRRGARAAASQKARGKKNINAYRRQPEKIKFRRGERQEPEQKIGHIKERSLGRGGGCTNEGQNRESG